MSCQSRAKTDMRILRQLSEKRIRNDLSPAIPIYILKIRTRITGFWSACEVYIKFVFERTLKITFFVHVFYFTPRSRDISIFLIWCDTPQSEHGDKIFWLQCGKKFSRDLIFVNFADFPKILVCFVLRLESQPFSQHVPTANEQVVEMDDLFCELLTCDCFNTGIIESET